MLKEIFYSSLKISKYTRICMKANGFRVYRSRSRDQVMQKAYYSVPHQRRPTPPSPSKKGKYDKTIKKKRRSTS